MLVGCPRNCNGRPGTVLAHHRKGGHVPMESNRLLNATVLSSFIALWLTACATPAATPRPQGKAGAISPSWSTTAYASQDRDDAWHFAYAVQSWAGEQNGHVVMVPARHTIVVERAFLADELTHTP